MKLTSFLDNGFFYKGNVHCHSTYSDGHLTPGELAEAYKKRGYHFLAITDHNVYSHYTEFNTEDFITIPGVECNPRMPEGETRAYHFVAIPGSGEQAAKATLPRFTHGEKTSTEPFYTYGDLQAFIDNLYHRGYQVMFAHPFWSRIEYDQILPLDHLFSVEIMNNCSYVLENVGESNVCYDALLRRGKKLWCTAVDDNHNTFPLDSNKNDSFGGFIVVKAKSLTEQDICDAIASGSFYSSQGPEINDFFVEDGMIRLSCSPCARIYATGDLRRPKVAIAEKGGPLLTQFNAKLDGDEKYIRMECYDENGRKAYTNPIWL